MTKINIFNAWLNIVILNKPPYIPIPFDKALIPNVLRAKTLEVTNISIPTLEYSIDLSRLIVKAFEVINDIKDISNIGTDKGFAPLFTGHEPVMLLLHQSAFFFLFNFG
jgi:hypothetical protein